MPFNLEDNIILGAPLAESLAADDTRSLLGMPSTEAARLDELSPSPPSSQQSPFDLEDDIILGAALPERLAAEDAGTPLGVPPANADEIDDDDDVILGEPVEWPFGPPTLRTEMHLARDTRDEDLLVVWPSISELRAWKAAKAEEARAELASVLCNAGLCPAEAQRALRNAPRLGSLSKAMLVERLDIVRAAVPAGAAVDIINGAPTLLMHTRLSLTLPLKLRALADATGLTAERIAATAPALLLLDVNRLDTRLSGLRSALGPQNAPQLASILKRAPRLLACNPETVHANLAQLQCMLPAGVDVAAIVQRQPTLLAASSCRLEPKLTLLRELCTAEEWAQLINSTSFARLLTASISVIERLRVVPIRPDGQPRAVVSLLLLTKATFAAKYGTVAKRKKRKKGAEGRS